MDKNILLIELHNVVRIMLDKLVAQNFKHIRLTKSDNWNDFETVVNTQNPDVIVIDGRKGVAQLERHRDFLAARAVPVFVLFGLKDSMDAKSGVVSGVIKEMFIKPFEPTKIIDAIKKHLHVIPDKIGGVSGISDIHVVDHSFLEIFNRGDTFLKHPPEKTELENELDRSDSIIADKNKQPDSSDPDMDIPMFDDAIDHPDTAGPNFDDDNHDEFTVAESEITDAADNSVTDDDEEAMGNDAGDFDLNYDEPLETKNMGAAEDEFTVAESEITDAADNNVTNDDVEAMGNDAGDFDSNYDEPLETKNMGAVEDDIPQTSQPLTFGDDNFLIEEDSNDVIPNTFFDNDSDTVDTDDSDKNILFLSEEDILVETSDTNASYDIIGDIDGKSSNNNADTDLPGDDNTPPDRIQQTAVAVDVSDSPDAVLTSMMEDANAPTNDVSVDPSATNVVDTNRGGVFETEDDSVFFKLDDGFSDSVTYTEINVPDDAGIFPMDSSKTLPNDVDVAENAINTLLPERIPPDHVEPNDSHNADDGQDQPIDVVDDGQDQPIDAVDDGQNQPMVNDIQSDTAATTANLQNDTPDIPRTETVLPGNVLDDATPFSVPDSLVSGVDQDELKPTRKDDADNNDSDNVGEFDLGQATLYPFIEKKDADDTTEDTDSSKISSTPSMPDDGIFECGGGKTDEWVDVDESPDTIIDSIASTADTIVTNDDDSSDELSDMITDDDDSSDELSDLITDDDDSSDELSDMIIDSIIPIADAVVEDDNEPLREENKTRENVSNEIDLAFEDKYLSIDLKPALVEKNIPNPTAEIQHADSQNSTDVADINRVRFEGNTAHTALNENDPLVPDGTSQENVSPFDKNMTPPVSSDRGVDLKIEKSIDKKPMTDQWVDEDIPTTTKINNRNNADGIDDALIAGDETILDGGDSDARDVNGANVDVSNCDLPEEQEAHKNDSISDSTDVHADQSKDMLPNDHSQTSPAVHDDNGGSAETAPQQFDSDINPLKGGRTFDDMEEIILNDTALHDASSDQGRSEAKEPRVIFQQKMDVNRISHMEQMVDEALSNHDEEFEKPPGESEKDTPKSINFPSGRILSDLKNDSKDILPKENDQRTRLDEFKDFPTQYIGEEELKKIINIGDINDNVMDMFNFGDANENDVSASSDETPDDSAVPTGFDSTKEKIKAELEKIRWDLNQRLDAVEKIIDG